MPKIIFEGKGYLTEAGETVLDCLIRQGVQVEYSCQAGVCQTCMLKAVSGDPGPDSQPDLKDALKAQNYFLACSCVPEGDLELVRPGDALMHVTTVVQSMDEMNPEVMRLRLARPDDYTYFPGQFLNLFNSDGTGRSYSLASLAEGEDFLELHIRLLPKGQVSGWVHAQLAVGDTVTISHAIGDCFYTPGAPEQPLLLIGTGTGLAPLYGVLRDALRQSHSGPIHLYHGASTPAGLYLIEVLRTLAAEAENVFYRPCVSQGDAMEGFASARADQLALAEHADLSGWRVYLCGREEMVKAAQRKVFLAGVDLKNIHADAFLTAP